MMTRRVSRAAGLMFGKVRRFALVRFRADYVERQAAFRAGDCDRCGRCCEILFQCPFLIKSEEGSRCRIYGRHFEQCAAFPIDDRDLADVDHRCTYHFPEPRLIEVDTSGIRIGSDGPATPFEPSPPGRARLERVRKAGIVQAAAALLALLKERL
jgi:hypothetical protein